MDLNFGKSRFERCAATRSRLVGRSLSHALHMAKRGLEIVRNNRSKRFEIGVGARQLF